MKVAFDCHVPRRALDLAPVLNYEVVYYASHEHDELWFNAAMSLGAEVFVSADSDIENMALNSGKSFIRLPQGKGRGELTQFITQRLAALKKIEMLYVQNPGMVFVRK